MSFPSVLVLGATGRIGRILRACWPVERVIWQSRRPEPGTGWACFDPLTDAVALDRAAAGCDAVLNLAGVVPGQGAEMALNTDLALAAVRAGAASGARVLLASSAAVYGPGGGMLHEETALNPVSDYGRAKAAMEDRAGALAAERGVPVTALRIGNIAGSDAILGGWHPGFVLDRFADGRTPVRSYTGPVTLARVLAELCVASGLPGVLNVAAPAPVEMAALLDAAGLAWTPRAAPETAIPRVHLSADALCRFTRFSERDSLPSAMVAEWRSLEPDAGRT